MSSVILTGDTSGTLTVSAPLVAGSNTVTLPAATGTISLLTRATAVASTSGTSIDFTGIPSWAKRITVMLAGVSGSGTSVILFQLGDSGGIENTGYLSTGSRIAGGTAASADFTAGFGLGTSNVAGEAKHGSVTFCLVDSNTWVASGVMTASFAGYSVFVSGSKTLSDTLTQLRITTVNGTDTFDAGSINVMWEG
jgi:hypothetical protein